MTKYKNKYRVESHRRTGWNYGSNAQYFVTICCNNRKSFFGTVVDEKMILTEIGKIANTYWQAIPEHFSNVILHNHIIMPNHMHGIIEIAKAADAIHKEKAPNLAEQTPNLDVSTDSINSKTTTNLTEQTPNLGASTSSEKPSLDSEAANRSISTSNATEKWKPGILGVIINQYKRIYTIKARKINSDFGWQSNYHDKVIRDQSAFKNISNYIVNNPKKWTEDTFNK